MHTTGGQENYFSVIVDYAKDNRTIALKLTSCFRHALIAFTYWLVQK